MAIRTSLIVVTAISLVFSRSGMVRAEDCRATSKLWRLDSSASAPRIRSVADLREASSRA